MSREILQFVQTGPISMALEGGSTIPRIGCCIITLTFKQPTQVGEIAFRNFYTWAVSVHVLRSRTSHSGGEPEVNWRDPSAWQVAITNKFIMPHPHTETGSHDYVSITCLESAVEWQEVAAMRLLLRQPSSVWQTFTIEHLTVYRELPRLPPFSVPIMNSSNTQFGNRNTELSPLERLINQTENALKKDLDCEEENLSSTGGYEISSLQYT